MGLSLKSSICFEPPVTLFNEAQAQVENLISNTTYPNFLKSDMYLQFVQVNIYLNFSTFCVLNEDEFFSLYKIQVAVVENLAANQVLPAALRGQLIWPVVVYLFQLYMKILSFILVHQYRLVILQASEIIINVAFSTTRSNVTVVGPN